MTPASPSGERTEPVAARDLAAEMTPEQLAARLELRGLVTGYYVSRALAVVAELGVADALAAGPLESEALAAEVRADPGSLRRVMRALAGIGIFHEDGAGFSLTELGTALRSDVPHSVRELARYHGEEWLSRAWGGLLEGVRTGRPPVELALGQGLFEFLDTHGDALEVFHRGMTAVIRNHTAILEVYDFSPFGTIVDVGGANGALLCEILAQTLESRGIVYDRPPAAEAAVGYIAARGLADRCEAQGGDFFGSVPAGADLYVLSNVLNDWSDPGVETILGNVARASGDGAHVLVLEAVLPEEPDDSYSWMGDLSCLVLTTGRIRSESDFRRLFAAAGIELTRVVPTAVGSVSGVEGAVVRPS